MKKRFFVAVVCVLIVVGQGFAASDIYVDGILGNNAWPGDTPTSPVKTIQTGVNIVDAGGTVHVAGGTYIESIAITNPVALVSTANPTIAPSSGNAVRIQPPSGTVDGVILDGFTITGASGLSIDEGMVPGDLVVQNLNIKDCIFDGSTWEGFSVINGAQVTTCTIQGCTFQNNSNGIAGSGGSLLENWSITGCTITGNSAQGIYFFGGCSFTDLSIQDSTIGGGANPPVKFDGCGINGFTIEGGSLSNGPYGLDIRGVGYNVTNVMVKNATIHSNASYGIIVFPGVIVDDFKVEGCTFDNNGNSIYFIGTSMYSLSLSNVEITGNKFTNTGSTDITVTSNVNFGAGDVKARLNQFLGAPSTTGISNAMTTVLDGTNNYWGHSSGPSGAGTGSGVLVSSNVNYFPWSYFGGVYEQAIGTGGGTVSLVEVDNNRYKKHRLIIPGLTQAGTVRMVPPSDRHGLNNAVEIILSPGSTLTSNATLTVEFTVPDDRMGGYTWEQMRLARWNGSSWDIVPGSVCNWSGENSVTGQVSGFSIFGVAADPGTVPVEISVFEVE